MRASTLANPAIETLVPSINPGRPVKNPLGFVAS